MKLLLQSVGLMPSESESDMSDSLRPHELHSPWNSPSQNTGVDRLSLLQGIFPTQGSNLGLPHYRRILYQLSHQGNPRILGWVASPFSRGSSRPRNRTGVSHIAGGFFTSWATREALTPKPVPIIVLPSGCEFSHSELRIQFSWGGNRHALPLAWLEVYTSFEADLHIAAADRIENGIGKRKHKLLQDSLWNPLCVSENCS